MTNALAIAQTSRFRITDKEAEEFLTAMRKHNLNKGGKWIKI